MLSSWDYVLSLSIGAFIIFLVIILMCCANCIGWPIYRWIHRNDHLRPQKSHNSPMSNIMLRHVGNSEVNRATFLIKPNRRSAYTTVSEIGTRRTLKTIQSNKNLEPTKLQLLVKYIINKEGTSGKLHFHIKAFTNIPQKPYPGSLETFGRFIIFKRKSIGENKKKIILEQETETLRHTMNPKFDVSFVIEIKRMYLKDLMVKILLFDKDKYSSPTELAHIEFPLRELWDFSHFSEEYDKTIPMMSSKMTTGRVLLGLNYLPTAQRLCLTIVQADNLDHYYLKKNISEFRPFVRVYYLAGIGSRIVKRKKTSTRYGTITPVFNETITFTVPPELLETVTLLICVVNEDIKRDSDENLINVREKRDERPQHLGKFAVGSNVRDQGAIIHWVKAITTNRTVITKWHTLF